MTTITSQKLLLLLTNELMQQQSTTEILEHCALKNVNISNSGVKFVKAADIHRKIYEMLSTMPYYELVTLAKEALNSTVQPNNEFHVAPKEEVFIFGRELFEVKVDLSDGEQMMTFIEDEIGRIFSVHSSYLEQSVGAIKSPYGDNCTIIIND